MAIKKKMENADAKFKLISNKLRVRTSARSAISPYWGHQTDTHHTPHTTNKHTYGQKRYIHLKAHVNIMSHHIKLI